MKDDKFKMNRKTNKKILLICVTSQNVITFRTELIKKLQENKYEVSVVAFDDEYKEEIKALKVEFFCIKEQNRGTNPLKILSLKRKYKKIIQQIQPDVVFTFMLKPNIFGALAAKSSNIKDVYAMVEGAGDVFLYESLKWKIVRFVVCKLYKKAFKHVKKIFFLNNDDKNDFVARKLVHVEQCEVLHGIGVDLEKFAFRPIKNHRTFLMVARMLETKGIYEFCKCARLVKQKYPDAIFNYIGGEGTVGVCDIQEYIDEGSINYLGTTKDVRPYLEDCSVFVLPSHYREGLPMSIMEAEAIGRPVLTCNNVGCKDSISNNYNGYLVPRKDYQALAEKCCEFIENPQKLFEMGENSRKYAEQYFNCKLINQKIYEAICK